MSNLGSVKQMFKYGGYLFILSRLNRFSGGGKFLYPEVKIKKIVNSLCIFRGKTVSWLKLRYSYVSDG